jgi:GTP:adenosylcobinamide-phosphate guanylyltransferase
VPAKADRRFTVIILAAQRAGQLDPLAAEAGVSHKCLVPILGRPLIEYVLDALADTPGVRAIRICVEPDVTEQVKAVPGASGERGFPIDYVPSAATITESVYRSAAGVEGPILVTTADNVNLTPEAVLATMAPIAGGQADCTIALASREAVIAARKPGEAAHVTYDNVGPYKFRDGRFSNCNLYGFAGPHVLEPAEAFREGGQFSKQRQRLAKFVGPVNILLYVLRLMSLKTAMKRISRRVGVRIEAALLEDGAQAIDVDNPRTYRIAETILKRKAASGGSAA